MNQKKQYTKPELKELGTIEQMTNSFFSTSAADSYTYANLTIQSNGSQGGNVVGT